MPRRRRFALAAAVVLTTLLRTTAAAEPEPQPACAADYCPNGVTEPLHLVSGSTVTTDGGTTVILPPGAYVLTPETWDLLDDEVTRLQAAETRLRAENDTFRRIARAAGPGWGTITLAASALLAGMAVQRWIIDR
jgi:hypothetical protein